MHTVPECLLLLIRTDHELPAGVATPVLQPVAAAPLRHTSKPAFDAAALPPDIVLVDVLKVRLPGDGATNALATAKLPGCHVHTFLLTWLHASVQASAVGTKSSEHPADQTAFAGQLFVRVYLTDRAASAAGAVHFVSKRPMFLFVVEQGRRHGHVWLVQRFQVHTLEL